MSESNELGEFDARWRLREQEWARKLGRLRLGVEPLQEQLARYRRVTWGLTIVPGIMTAMFLTLFSVFGRPDIGLLVVGVLFTPMIFFSWLGYKKIERRAALYLDERARFEAQRLRFLGSQAHEPTTSQPD
jgi:hypothetical protein